MAEKKFYALYRGKKKFTGISSYIDNGASLSVYDDHNKAKKTANKFTKRFQAGFLVKELKDPLKNFNDFSDQGYAGALLNDKEPILFCEDDKGYFSVARIDIRSGDTFILSDELHWSPVPEKTTLHPLKNYIKIDERLITLIDDEPIWGWSVLEHFYGIQERSSGTSVLLKDALSSEQEPVFNTILFANEKLGQEALKSLIGEENTHNIDMMRVEDVYAYVQQHHRQKQGVLLNPGTHRCLQGRFWFDQKVLLLESYSGMWRYIDKQKFEKIVWPYKTDRVLNSTYFFWTLAKGERNNLPAESPLPAVNISFPNFDIELLKNKPELKRINILLNKTHIEQLELSPLVDFIQSIIEQGMGPRFKDSFSFKITGFHNTEQAPFEIFSLRAWYRQLWQKVPYIVYFLESEGDQIRSFVLSLIQTTSDQGLKKEVSEDLFHTIVDVTMHAMRLALLVHNEPADSVQKIFEAFDIEPDPDLYEKMLSMIEQPRDHGN